MQSRLSTYVFVFCLPAERLKPTETLHGVKSLTSSWAASRRHLKCCLQVLGLVGTNGIGKSTALKILSGKLKPNLGRFRVSKGAV